MTRVKCCVFISSPGDVGQERLIASRVLERLAGEFNGRVQIEPVLWEHEPLRATQHFQEQLILPSQTDLVICILWSRLGTRLPEGFHRADGTTYSSGTEWEFEEAAKSFQTTGTPDLLVYRKTGQMMIPLTGEQEVLERLNQQRALQSFIDRWFGNPHDGFKAAFHAFQSAADFESILEVHVRRWLEERLRQSGQDVNEEAAAATWYKGSPFRGLSAFEYEHAPVFFGRTSAIASIKEALVKQGALGRPFVLVLGMSGGGKSSVVKAGLLPTLTQPGVVDGIGLWRWATLRPSNSSGDLCDGLAAALLSTTCLPELVTHSYDAKELAALLREAPQRVIAPIRATLNLIAENVRQSEQLPHVLVPKVALVIDQLEEIFSLPSFTGQHRTTFMAAVSALVKSGQVWTVATMRSDFYPRCAELSDLVALKESEGQFDLLPPTFAETRQMIVAPARAAGLKFESDASNTSLDMVLHEASAQDPRSLPLLEFTLDELYNRRTAAGILTMAAYQELGGLEGAIANRAEEIFNQLDPAIQNVLPQLMRKLVTLRTGSSEQLTATRVTLKDAAAIPHVNDLIDAFVRARLLVTDRAADGSAVVGVAHEALLTRWPRLSELIKEDREFLRIRTLVAGAASRWRSEDRLADFLLAPGKPLVEAEDMMSKYGAEVDDGITEYVSKSSEAARTSRRRKRILTLIIGSAFMVTALTFGAVSFAMYLRASSAATNERIARDDAEQALTTSIKAEANAKARQEEAIVALKAEAAAKAESDRMRVQAERDYDAALNSQILLANRNFESGDLAGARQLLRDFPEDRRRWEWDYVNRICNDNRLVLNHERFVVDAMFSPDGRHILTCSGELSSAPGKVTIWDSQYGTKEVVFEGHTMPVTAAIWHPSGKWIVSISPGAHEVFVWDAKTKEIVQRFSVNGAAAIAMPGEGNLLAIGGKASGEGDKKSAEILLVDAIKGTEVARLSGHRDDIKSLSFSSDGKRLVSVGEDRVARAWDIENRRLMSEFVGDKGYVWTVSISPDGSTVASSGYGHIIHLWEFATGNELRQLNGHESSVTCVSFSPDGRQVASCGWDQLVKVWEVDTGREIFNFRGHENWVTAVGFSPVGGSLVSSSWDDTARVWDLNRAKLREFEIGMHIPVEIKLDLGENVSGSMTNHVEDIAIHPSGNLLAIAGPFQCYVKPLGANLPPHELEGGHDLVSYSSDGTLIAAKSPDNIKLVIWKGKTDSKEIPTQGGPIHDLVFSPTEHRIAVASVSGVEIIDADSGQNDWQADKGNAIAKSIAWRPDGSQIATGHFNGQVVLWSQTGAPDKIFDGLAMPVFGVAFNPSGTLIAAGGGAFDQPGELAIWNVDSGELIQRFHGHSKNVSCLLFTNDGERLVSGSADRTIRFWDVKSGKETLILRDHGEKISSMALSRDGNKLYSSSFDGKILLWDKSPIVIPEVPKQVQPEVPEAILE